MTMKVLSYFFKAIPYISVARFDKPAAIFLILCPCYWGLAYSFHGIPPFYWIILFAIGAFVMRGAGCVFNDWVDRALDRQVNRTKNRPFATGQLSTKQGAIFFSFLCLMGLGILSQFPIRCWGAGLLAFSLLIIYPFMKRLTYWPQAVLGLAFNSGLWVGALVDGPLKTGDILSLSILYGASIAWTIAYDTIYAFQDLEDDQRVGIKSTAVRFALHGVRFVRIFYGLFLALLLYFGFFVNASSVYFIIVIFLTVLSLRDLYFLNPQDPEACLTLFKKNKWIGIGLFMALIFR